MIDTTYKKGDITILAELHDNDSGMAEIMNQVNEAPPRTPVLIEMPAIINGMIRAFDEGKISQEKLGETLQGMVFPEFQNHADSLAKLISDLKERGTPIIAIDGRDNIDAQQSNIPTLEEYTNRKHAQMANEKKDFDSSIEQHPDNANRLIQERDIRMGLMQSSLDTVTQYASYSPVNANVDDMVRGMQKSGALNMDLLTAEMINRYSENGHAIALLGEGHVDGERLNISPLFQSYGIVGEGLKAMGKEPRVISVRQDIADFPTKRSQMSGRVTEKMDEYLVVNPDSGARLQTFKSEQELRDALMKSEELPRNIAAGLRSGTYAVSREDTKGLPSADQDPEYSALLKNFEAAIPKIPVLDVKTNSAPDTSLPKGKASIAELNPPR